MKKLFTLLLLSSSLFLVSCGDKPKNTDVSGSAVSSEANGLGALEINADSDSGKAGALQTVYFDFNSAVLKSETRSSLENNANFLKENPSVKVIVEGHCDERGSVQYNVALGEKRANSIKRFLVSMGVESSRIETATYGKERPIAFGHDESAWSQNRRGNFVISAK